MKTPRDGFSRFSARRARRGDAVHRKTGATTSESHEKPPSRSRPHPAGDRQEALTIHRIDYGFLPTRRKADTISMGLHHRSLVLGIDLTCRR